MKKTKCYIYTRVSTAMQLDGYSLDAQKDKLKRYAAHEEMQIVGEYSDEGHSGKNIAGRPDFLRMLEDIEDGKDEVSFVLVFKLSRFGRNAAVEEVISKMVNNPKFKAALTEKIGSKIDTSELENEKQDLRKCLQQTIGAKNKLAEQMDKLDITDRNYDRKYQDMQDRIDKLYDEMSKIEDEIASVTMRIENLQKNKLSAESVYRILLSFDRLYSEFTDLEKKKFLGSFVKDVLIHDNELEDGRFLKTIRFRFPVYYGGLETEEIDLDSSNFWDKETTGETCCLLERLRNAKDYIPLKLDMEDYYKIKDGEKL